MREIKFRVWQKSTQTMHTYLKVKFGKSINITLDGKFKDVDQVTTKTVSNRDLELLQYVGKKDKNGTEIYEGDILLTPSRQRWCVRWETTTASFVRQALADGVMGDLIHAHEDEVIGNIYESLETSERENQIPDLH